LMLLGEVVCMGFSVFFNEWFFGFLVLCLGLVFRFSV
jgi:hypothetical protein